MVLPVTGTYRENRINDNAYPQMVVCDDSKKCEEEKIFLSVLTFKWTKNKYLHVVGNHIARNIWLQKV